MKKLVLALVLAIGVGILAPAGVGVAAEYKPADVCQQTKSDRGTPSYCETITNNDDPVTGSEGILNKVVSLVAFAAGIIAVIMIIISGFRYVTSNGEPDKAASARKTLLYAIVGLVIVILAQTIVTFVLRNI